MNPDFLVRGVLHSVLGGGRKRSRRALRYLTGSPHSFLTRPTTLLTAAGVAWGIFETLAQQPGSPATGGVTAAPGSVTPVPPLPATSVETPPSVESQALRVVQLAISAANADGVMSDKERAAVVQQAHAAGVGDVVEREFQQRRPLAEIVAGVSDPTERATLYVLGYTVLRADEQVTGAERIYLAQLANLLQLDPQTVQKLEADTAERINSGVEQGESGVRPN